MPFPETYPNWWVHRWFDQLNRNGQLSGLILLLATVCSMLVANSSVGLGYLHFWEMPIGFSWLTLPVEQWINDGLMAIFFFLVGIEIKRELLVGELSDLSRSILPIGAALGGILVPGLIYLSLNADTDAAGGWAIPAATDIAFSLAILSLLGKRVPVSLKVFLAALAIIDDSGAIFIIAFFYTKSLQAPYLLASVGLLGLLIVFNRCNLSLLWPYLMVGFGLWFCVLQSGVHATLAGVLLASVMPLNRITSLVDRLHFTVNYGILPLFALTNTAITLTSDAFAMFTQPVGLGVLLGLIIGKPLGVLFTCFSLIKSRLARLPAGATWPQLVGVGFLAGIGFTISVFVATLSFKEMYFLNLAKLATLTGSLVSGLLGLLMLRLTTKKAQQV
ncbi:Na+/H+ antiporter NhaA [Spirosoma pollinicola]|uniref:Na(+)/H(+) antiporter NhaA n=1 Tax=Spirosoma pollinicola TaxID=2057025 RepID=A0A2K8Z678_9BACT|nr:Na+/H+ antiporter NhaA [Spirosoma pollinicola]AUD05375.1 Na+/H+ antiporter NhaA [Spirosoma pollinicola]